MNRNRARTILAAALVLAPLLLRAQAVLDEVMLKDGSRIVGEVVGMKDGVLIVKPAFSATQSLDIGWGDVTDLKLSKPLPFQLEDGTQVVGVPEGIREGSIYVKSAELPQATAIPLAEVKSINAKPVAYSGLLAAGLSVSDGNTNNKTGGSNASVSAWSADGTRWIRRRQAKNEAMMPLTSQAMNQDGTSPGRYLAHSTGNACSMKTSGRFSSITST